VDRSSTSLVRFFGAEVFATTIAAAFGNTVVNGQNNEKTIDPSVARLTAGRVSPASLNITDFQIAVAHLERRGAAPLAAQAMALVFLDIAKIYNTSVMRVLDITNESQLKIVEAEAYKYINRLRNQTSWLAKSTASNNNNSYRARYLIP
jgi:hypothetical protein